MNKSNEVWQIYTEKFGGRAKARVLAQACYDQGVYADELGNHVIDWYEAKVIRVLKCRVDSETGLKATRPVGGEAAAGEWTQRALWNMDEHFEVVERLNEGVRADYTSLVGERDDCIRRFGCAPTIIELNDPWDRMK